MQPLPYDGTATDLVRGLDSLAKIFREAARKRNQLEGLISVPNPLQQAYLEMVIARVRHAQNLTRQFLNTFDKDDQTAAQTALRTLYRKSGYDKRVPLVTSAVDMGYCVAFIERDDKRNLQDHLGAVDYFTFGREFVLPTDLPQLIAKRKEELSDLPPQTISAILKHATAEASFPLVYTLKGLKTHDENSSGEVRLIEALFCKQHGVAKLNRTHIHERRHIQDIILGTSNFQPEGAMIFIETQAELYTVANFTGIKRDEAEFFEKLDQNYTTVFHELTKMDYGNNRADIRCENALEWLANLNAREKKAAERYRSAAALINHVQETNTLRVLKSFCAPLSYVFSTQPFDQVIPAFKMALSEYSKRPITT